MSELGTGAVLGFVLAFSLALNGAIYYAYRSWLRTLRAIAAGAGGDPLKLACTFLGILVKNSGPLRQFFADVVLAVNGAGDVIALPNSRIMQALELLRTVEEAERAAGGEVAVGKAAAEGSG